MKNIIYLIVLVWSVSLQSNIPTRDRVFSTVYDQIVRNKPEIDKEKAKRISKHINVVNKKYGIPRRIYAAILMQESRYKLNAVNKRSKDYGMSQINERTIKAFSFDKHRLLNDLEYSIEAGAIVLADFQKRHGKKEKTWFTRYNSGNKEKRSIYLKKISQWMPEDLKSLYE